MLIFELFYKGQKIERPSYELRECRNHTQDNVTTFNILGYGHIVVKLILKIWEILVYDMV